MKHIYKLVPTLLVAVSLMLSGCVTQSAQPAAPSPSPTATSSPSPTYDDVEVSPQSDVNRYITPVLQEHNKKPLLDDSGKPRHWQCAKGFVRVDLLLTGKKYLDSSKVMIHTAQEEIKDAAGNEDERIVITTDRKYDHIAKAIIVNSSYGKSQWGLVVSAFPSFQPKLFLVRSNFYNTAGETFQSLTLCRAPEPKVSPKKQAKKPEPAKKDKKKKKEKK